MKTLDLTSLNNSDIKYKMNLYPDGQRDIVILDICLGGNFYDLKNIPHDEQVDYVQIKSRLNNMEDLGLIICTTKALRNLGVKEIHLYTPWIMGLRSDRLFQEGGVRYIKDVLAPIINSLEFESVTCYDAHSYVAENCINNLKIIDNKQLVGFALRDINNGIVDPVATINKCILVSPDAGALHKIYKLAEQIDYKGDIITCSKERDTEGKLSKTIIPLNNLSNKELIIIDDICDGGATFINIAKAIREKQKDCKLYLIVTHSIFSKNTDELLKFFDKIYTTNSYKEHNMKNIEVLNIF